jgi:hypothetical protein
MKAHRPLASAIAAIFILSQSLAAPPCLEDSLDVVRTRYAIVGGGPAGLQMAHYLSSAGRPFALIDAQATNFFDSFPRFRQLISINKRMPPATSLDFALRHDWNSLLSDRSHSADRTTPPRSWEWPTEGDHTLMANANDSLLTVDQVLHDGSLFRNYSDAFFPHAGILAKYLVAFRSRHRWQQGKELLLGWRVANLTQDAACLQRDPSGGARFALEIHQSGDPSVRKLVLAQRVIVATSLSKPDKLELRGDASLIETYQTAPMDSQAYQGQRILIIGRGNAAFEIASLASTTAASVHIMGGLGRVRGSWETHYPGDVRMTHAQLLENYLLKSGDGLLEADTRELTILRGPSGGIWVANTDPTLNQPMPGSSLNQQPATTHPTADQEEALHFEDDEIHDDEDSDEEEPDDAGSHHEQSTVVPDTSPALEEAVTQASGVAADDQALGLEKPSSLNWVPPPHGPSQRNGAERLANLVACTDNCWSRREYDRVISCTGWGFEDSWFASDTKPARSTVRKYPSITPRFESSNVPGLFFAGSLAHSMDWKRAAGGFVHGFRYTARALHRILEADEEPAMQCAYGSVGIDAAGEQSDTCRLLRAPPAKSYAGLTKPRPPAPNAWPSVLLPTLGTTAERMLQRLRTTSGLYQMFGHLADLYVLPPPWVVTEREKSEKERLFASSGALRWIRPAARRTPVLPRALEPLPRTGLGWNLTDARELVDAKLPSVPFVHAPEVPLSLVPRLARQLYLQYWSDSPVESIWRPPLLAQTNGSVGFAEGVMVGDSRVDVASALSQLRSKAVDAWHSSWEDEDGSSLGALNMLSRCRFRPSPPVPLVSEERRLDTMLQRVKAPGVLDGLDGCWGAHMPAAVCFITVTLEYGKEHYTPGNDPFSPFRAVSDPQFAADSQFLHPVIRLWRVGLADPLDVLQMRLDPPRAVRRDVADDHPLAEEGPWRGLGQVLTVTGADRLGASKRPALSRIARAPAALMESHMVEDFLAEFDQPYNFESALHSLKWSVWPSREFVNKWSLIE